MPNNQATFNSIVTQIQNNQITVVDLSNQGITDSDCQILMENLTTNFSVLTLFLQDNFITPIGANYIAQMLNSNQRLYYIELGNNQITGKNQIGDTGATTIFSALETNTALIVVMRHSLVLSTAITILSILIVIAIHQMRGLPPWLRATNSAWVQYCSVPNSISIPKSPYPKIVWLL